MLHPGEKDRTFFPERAVRRRSSAERGRGLTGEYASLTARRSCGERAPQPGTLRGGGRWLYLPGEARLKLFSERAFLRCSSAKGDGFSPGITPH